MKFNDYKYVRPDMDDIKIRYTSLIQSFKAASSAKEQLTISEQINELSRHIDTMLNLVNIRHTINTADEYYDKEREYMDEASPVFQGLTAEYYKALSASLFKNELEKQIPKQYFTIADYSVKAYSDDVLKYLQDENKLCTEYGKLISSAKIDFEGKTLNLSQMQPYMQSLNRNTRKAAWEKYSGFFSDNMDKFDDIYDRMVKLRHKIAVKLGFKNFTELGYIRMLRTGYGPEDVANYRNQVLKHLVPLSVKLRNRQAKRLGVGEFKYYDKDLDFLTGNASPKGDRDWMLSQANRMYSELSPETKEFFSYMLERDLFDLDSKMNKESGAYCTFIQDYESPFIFANFNGTADDTNSLTHEAGHAFQVYRSRHIKYPELIFPTYESCEIHSMGMEFITWPWMKLFFKEDDLKYRFSHMASSIIFVPYGVCVDEFQHVVYANPQMSPAERRAAWRTLEKKYLPAIDYDDNEFYENGGYWFRQSHIFENPFYYIDYTLAQVCAFQFWVKCNQDRASAWQDYLNICDVGGTLPFLEILNAGNLKSPFADGTMEAVMEPIRQWLDSVDDSNM